MRARLPQREVRRFARYLVADAAKARRRSAWTELPVARLRDDAVLPAQAYDGDAGLDLAACERAELEPGERRSSAPASRSRFPTATRGWCFRAPGSRRVMV